MKKIAKELVYPDIVLKHIDAAKTVNEVDFIMNRARMGDFDYCNKKAVVC